MPVSNKPETSMALLPQQLSNQNEINSQAEPRRPPRQPTSLQGLLRFSMEATKLEDAPHTSEFRPMDEERKNFLEDALKSMTIDVVEILQKQIELLKKVSQTMNEDNVTEFVEAIDTILEYIDNIDIANDFHKIGGFMILYPCMKSPHPKLRAGGCELLAVLCQNNPHCQCVVLDNKFVPLLINMIDRDDDTTVITKSLYALSAIVRDNDEGFNQMMHYKGPHVLLNTIKKNNEKFIIKATFMLTSLCRAHSSFKGAMMHYKGPHVLLNTIKKNNEKFIIKATFMLTSLCRAHSSFKDHLVELGYVPTLIALISTARSQSHEHVLSLLVCLVEDNITAIEECKNSIYKLKDYLQKYISSIKQKEECQEEEEYCKRLLHVLNTGL